MERRDFLKAPALGILLPGMVSLESIGSAGDSGQQGAVEQPRKFTQKLHPDFETYLPGIEYFTLGNGDIIAVIQYAPDRTGERPLTFLGLTIMDAERFARKWSTFLFHPEDGFGRSMLGVSVDGTNYFAQPERFVSIGWKYPDTVPVVSAQWKAGSCLVEEEFFVPDQRGILFRRVHLTNTGAKEANVSPWMRLAPSFVMFDEIGVDEASKTVKGEGFAKIRLQSPEEGVTVAGRYDMMLRATVLAPGSTRTATFIYSIRGDESVLKEKTMDALWAETVQYWKSKPVLTSGNDILDHLALVSRTGLKSQVARSGKRDSGFWMYNMEWVRDDIMVMLGMLQAGFFEEARTVLKKVLEKSVGADGRTIESSRWSGYDYTELDQNGQLLYGIWAYLVWTGDEKTIRSYWKKIRPVGDFPLQEVFREKATRMLRNKREFWERSDQFGVEDGFELAYQFWVILGLEHAADVAKRLGDAETARRWKAASAEIKHAMLEEKKFRLIEEGRLIKRRTREGGWQRFMIPLNRNAPPKGSPLATLEQPACEPDTASLYPIMFEMVDPRGEVARKTLASMEELWNQRWSHGGYARYNTDSEPDPPGPWPFASLFVARAYAEAGESEKVWRILRWLHDIHGGKAGAWFERYGPSITPPAPPVSVVGWTWSEIVTLAVHHIMGFRPGLDGLAVRPRLLEGINQMKGQFRVRGSTYDLTIRKTGTPAAAVKGVTSRSEKGTLMLPYPPDGSAITIDMSI